MADVTVNETSTDPNEHYSCGFRAMVLGDYGTAVAAFGRCSELKAAQVGDKDDSLGETYYFYGKCLLEAAREEQNELGDAIPNEDDEDDEEEGEGGDEEEGESGDAARENDANEAKDSASSTTNGDASKEEQVATNGTAASSSAAVSASTNGASSGGDGDDGKQEADSTEEGATGSGAAGGSGDDAAPVEEEATDLQVAWEVLELAKIIFENRGDVAKEKLADTLILLGEVSLESENFESGIEDIQHGVEIHKSVYGSDDRKLAESYYKLGMAMATCSRYDEAAENFKNSLNILRNVITRLENCPEKDTDKIKCEIVEVKSLMPEIEEKIIDTQTTKKEAITALMNSLAEASPKTDGGAASSSSGTTASSAKPTDISHLVKRKRKVEDGEVQSTTDAALPIAKKPTP